MYDLYFKHLYCVGVAAGVSRSGQQEWAGVCTAGICRIATVDCNRYAGPGANSSHFHWWMVLNRPSHAPFTPYPLHSPSRHFN